MSGPVAVVGIGADGWSGLGERARTRVREAEVLLGGDRHLALVPDVSGQTRETWPRPLLDGLPGLLASYAGRRVVVLASGDPTLSGIGSTLVGLLGPDAVEMVPAVSSVVLARARMGWSAEESTIVTLVGRDPDALRRELADGRRLVVLSSDESTPGEVARILTDAGYPASTLTVLGDLGGPAESRVEVSASGPVPAGLPRLHVLAIAVCGADGPATNWAPGLPDDAFEHDGQLTKRDARASALARLAPRPGQLLWDVGAGAGSVAIEWLRAHRTTRAIAFEADDERARRIGRNAAALGVPRLEVVPGRAPAVLAGRTAPDAIFVGGGATEPGLLEQCRTSLAPGGRLVAHGVTFETERLLLAAYDEHGGELTRISIEHAAPLSGRFHGWRPARAVLQWSWIVPDEKHPHTSETGAFRQGLPHRGAP